MQESERAQSEQRKNQEEEDQQPVSERRVFIVPGGPAVHAAAVTFDLTVGRSPAVVTVTVLVAVAHPVSVTLLLHVAVVVQDIGAATLEVHTDLVVSTLGSFVHHTRVGDV